MLEILYSVFIAAAACYGFCIIFNIRDKNMWYSIIGAALGWLAYLLIERMNIGGVIPYFISGVVVSLYSEILARIRHQPSTCFLIIGILPLVPGGGVYYTMKFWVQGNYIEFGERGMATLASAGAIALGIMFIISIFRLFAAISARKHLKRIKSK